MRSHERDGDGFRRDGRHSIRPGDDGARAGDRLLLDVVRRAGPWLGPLLALGTLGAAAALVLPAVLGRAVDQVVAASQGTAGWGPARSSLTLTAALVGFLVAEDAITQLAGGAGAARETGELRRRLVRHVLASGPAASRACAEGDLVARIVGGTQTAARVVTLATGLVGALIPPVGGVVALALVDPWLAVTFGAGTVLASGAVRAYLRDSRVVNAGYLEAQGTIAARLVDAQAGARTIAAARTAEREVARVLGPLDGLRAHGLGVWRTMARLAFRGEPVVLLTQVAVVAVAGLGLAAGRLTAGEMLAASRYAVMAAGIGGIIGELAGLGRARAGAQRVAAVLEVPGVAHGDRSLPPAGPGSGALDLRGVDAGSVLRGLDLFVPGGTTVALVGRSGSGKSLVAALAGRLRDPDAGEVLLDGVPLTRLDRGALRRAVAYAFERPTLVTAGDGTIAGAIAFGDEPVPAGRVERAALDARADGFVRRLPDGYAAPLAATPMSGGELQRLGLARALARDARLLVLDDATSSLDTATEAEIAAALTGSTTGRTRLIVTHRTTTAARADLVAWLDGGRVRAFGPHAELWADPAYRAVFRPDEGAEARPAGPEPAGPEPTEPEPGPPARAGVGGHG